MFGTNQYECTRCYQLHKKKNDATKKMSINRSPEVLCLHLKRFNSMEGRTRQTKLNRHVVFPLRGLDLSPYLEDNDGSTPVDDKKKTALYYDLVGLIRHHGNGVRSGHYVSYVKRISDDSWWLCDDAAVRQVEERDVLSQQAYVLMYQRRKTVDEEKEQEADIMDLFMNHYDKSNAERIRYLSSYWIKKRSLLGLAVAGPPSNADVLCRHGLLLRRCRQRMLGVEGIDLGTDSHFSFPVVPIKESLYMELITKEGYDETTNLHFNNKLTVASLVDSCRDCQLEGDKLKARRADELMYLDQLEKGVDIPLTNEMWYLVDTGWWRKWKEWLYSKRSVPLADQIGREMWGMDEDVCGVLPPGEITNHVLLQPQSNVPRLNLKSATHYRGVSKELWSFFVKHHGGGPEIIRPTFNLYDQ